MTKKATNRCPRCGTKSAAMKEGRNALSRKDNTTHICPDCGTDTVRAGRAEPWNVNVHPKSSTICSSSVGTTST